MTNLKNIMVELGSSQPFEYYNYIKENLQESELDSLNKELDILLNLIKNAKSTGQSVFIDIISTNIRAIIKERILVS